MSVSRFFGRLSLFLLVASGAAGLGCRTAPRSGPPLRFTLRPTVSTAPRSLVTPAAVELVSEHDAREVEAADGQCTGEIGVSGTVVQPAQIAQVAAEHGATHFRIITAGEELRVDVLLYRVEPTRWSTLPESLRPAPAPGRTAQPQPPSREAQSPLG